MLFSSLALTALAAFAVATPTPTQHEPRSASYHTIKFRGAFFELDQIFTTPIYTPTPIKNGAQPYVGPDAPKFFYRNWMMDPSAAGPLVINGNLGSTKCLDAGSWPQNGNRVHMWDCYAGLTQQQWVVQNGRIKLANFNLCLDVPDGNTGNNYVQVWECFDGNTNQQWTVNAL